MVVLLLVNQSIYLSNDSSDSTNPNLITVPNNLYVISNDNSTKNYNVMIKRSSDGGITFSQPNNLSNTTNSNSINPQLAATVLCFKIKSKFFLK